MTSFPSGRASTCVSPARSTFAPFKRLKLTVELCVVQTYLAGESYAGQYIPYFGTCFAQSRPTFFFLRAALITLRSFRSADEILRSDVLPNFPLKGIAIGNGWIDPREQYPGYVDFAYEHKLVKAGTPVSLSLLFMNLLMLFCQLIGSFRAQQAEQLAGSLARCQAEIDLYKDLESLPINMGGCGPVMDQVTVPFTQE